MPKSSPLVKVSSLDAAGLTIINLNKIKSGAIGIIQNLMSFQRLLKIVRNKQTLKKSDFRNIICVYHLMRVMLQSIPFL